MARIISSYRLATADIHLTELYRSLQVEYPKFFKMDTLSKLGFIAAEHVFRQAGLDPAEPKTDLSLALMNRASCMDNDVEFQKGLAPDNYFPSPSLFVYTLSNIVCGEIAIRHHIYGETSFFVDGSFSAQRLMEVVSLAFADPAIHRVLCGWVDIFAGKADCCLMLVDRQADEGVVFDENGIQTIINR